MKIKSIFIIASLFLVSCTKESMTGYKTFLKNNTDHMIVIKPYHFGSVAMDKIITLPPSDSLQIAEGSERGIVTGVVFSSEYFIGMDSLVVNFDNLYNITHYFILNPALNTKYYEFTSNRNLGNGISYAIKIEDVSKYSRHNTYTYTFTEQDYLDAK